MTTLETLNKFVSNAKNAQTEIDKLCRTNDPQTSKDAAKRMEYPKLIPLTQGKFAIVDADLYDELSKYNWYLNSSKTLQYACRAVKINGKYKHIYMHRHILKATKGQEIDHINGRGLDNRIVNIRFCTHLQNLRNRAKCKKCYYTTSKYKGVHWSKSHRRWCVQVKHKFVGYFKIEKEAAKAYDKVAKELYGEFARTNF